MQWWEALILGIVEGLTEYLPVSSTGHLILAQQALGLEAETEQEIAAHNAYAIVIQAGAILAVASVFWSRVKQMSIDAIRGDKDGRNLLTAIVVGIIPAAVIGLIFEDMIDEHLMNLWYTVAAWFIGGVLILVIPRVVKTRGSEEGKTVTDITIQMALVIGLLQCVAMWPGTSRSLMTIAAGMLVGLSLVAAVEFSFLLGMVTLLAASGYKFLKHYNDMAEHLGWQDMIIGTVAAWIAAVISVKWMLGYLRKHGLALFGYYRIALAIVVAILILLEVIQPSFQSAF
ncbi:MAG: undecaprenyl-diphosphate phosphatase [Phycisphaeraceae bacterium]|nr:undecaprenyl-diphosphate phosphatase [Phycisphaeraceae bacterium]